MDAFGTSSCPLCRSNFSHLPVASPLLHKVVAGLFPEAFVTRAKEVKEEELRYLGYSGVDVERAAAEAEASTREIRSEETFKCSRCDEFLFAPCLLFCGHAAC
eukprot:CAMPEP_0170152184 /NCGR_PEP_ID=MMETSP0033_2-20121228/51870_1 /TAXON_ID=195969 /ORGANISM="Dolichomastix tenuilepis, Strain CCMP3274" /LENGTH=102 /DNA_ID=CAMNT_0010389319 /DNA_START=42 /DNA_END=347 /DNA_ORIENTATION=-